MVVLHSTCPHYLHASQKCIPVAWVFLLYSHFQHAYINEVADLTEYIKEIAESSGFFHLKMYWTYFDTEYFAYLGSALAYLALGVETVMLAFHLTGIIFA